MIVQNTLLTLMLAVGIGILVWQHPPAVWTWVQILGLCILAPGFVLWTVARFQLGRSMAVTAQAKQLVTSGFYAKIRNPIYVFGSFVITGLILVMGRPIWLLVFLLIIPLQLWRARKEASVLEAKFGDDYRKYRATTWF